MAPQLIVEMTADEAKVFAAQQKVIRQQEKMVAKYKELAQAGKKQTDSSERAARSHDRAFGQPAQASVAAFAAGVSKVVAIAAGLAPAFAASSAELQRNLELLRGAEGGLGQLAQLARTPEEFQALQREARDIYAGGGAPDLDSAARQLFGLVSAELNDRDRRFMSELGASGFNGFQDLGALATSINTLQTTFGQQAGSARDLVNAGIAASVVAPATVPELLAGTARSAGTGGRLGFKPEELLAATTFASKATGSAEVGGTQVASLMRSIGESIDQFQSRNLAGIIREIEGRNLNQTDLKDLLGRAEAIEAFSTLAKNMDSFVALQRSILDAQRKNAVNERMEFLREDPMLRTFRAARQAEADATLTDQQRAAERALFETMISTGTANRRRAGTPAAVGGGARVAGNIVEFLGLERTVVEALQRYQPEDVRERIRRELESIDTIRQREAPRPVTAPRLPPGADRPPLVTAPPRPAPPPTAPAPRGPDPNDRQAPQMPPPPGPTPRERNIPDDGRPIPVDIGMDDMLRMRDVPVMPSIRPDLTATRDRPQIIADRPVERVPMPTLDRVGDRQQDRQQSQDVLANLNRSSDTTAMAEVARQQLDVARQQLEALRQLTDQRSRPPAVPQLSAARHEQAQSAETGK